MSHDHGHRHNTDIDWAAMAANLTREAEVLLPYVVEAAEAVAHVCREDGIEVGRILDIGSGPGVVSCELARHFTGATVVAADGSEPLLRQAKARAEEAGLSRRVEPLQIELPDGVDTLGHADLIWMAMVLHHVGDESAMLHRLRALLEPQGVLALSEHGEPFHFLAEGAAPCPPGFSERLAALEREWLGEMRADLPGWTPSEPYVAMLTAAGFTVAVDRVVHVRLAPPLADAPRQFLLSRLRRMWELFAEQLEPADRSALDVLTDEGDPLGVLRRDDAFLDVSRHVYVATVGARLHSPGARAG